MVSGAFAILVGSCAAAALFFFPLIPGVLASVMLVALVRFPVIQSTGTVRLDSDEDHGTVRSEFESTTPPILAFQWGVADKITATDTGAQYHITYLFGLRSKTMAVEHWTPSDPGGEASNEIELEITSNGKAWGTYLVSTVERNDRTRVEIEWHSDRRFGLRRLPQWVVAERFREAVISSLGYTVVDRTASLTFVGGN